MMGASDLLKETLGDFPVGDITCNLLAAKAMVRNGLAVVLIEPMGSKPLCILNERQRAAADKEAQANARAAGTVRWDMVRHPCGLNHAIVDAKELAKPRVKELLAAGANLAVVPGLSSARVIIVDLDKEEEVRGFREDWADGDPEFDLDDPPPITVSSPGKMRLELDGTEVWAHKHGGHQWFTAPEGFVFPASPGKIKGKSGWVAYFGSDCYVIVPPSVRAEGPYRLTGATMEAPRWLLDRILAADNTAALEERLERIQNAEGDDDIDEWSARTSWDELLRLCGWTPTGKLDTCACPTWTRPGTPAHDKSATAHEAGCVQYDTSAGHGPIHAWSDSVSWGGQKTVTKLTFLAYERYDGDMVAAMASIGVTPAGLDRDFSELEFEEGLDLILDAGAVTPSPKAGDLWGEEEESQEKRGTWHKRDLTAILAGTDVRPEAKFLPRVDGPALLYPGLTHSVHGESESAKSLVLMGEAVRVMQAGGRVLWISCDSDEREDVARALKYGCPPEVVLAQLDYVRPEEPADMDRDGFLELFTDTYDLAVIDGVTDAMLLVVGGDQKDPNNAATLFSRRLPERLAERTGAAVVLIDHVTKDRDGRGRHAIGGQAKLAKITGAAYMVQPGSQPPKLGGVGEVVFRIGKDRPGSVRPHGGPWRASDRSQEIARITIDDTGSHTVMTVNGPADPMDQEEEELPKSADSAPPCKTMERLSEAIASWPDGISKTSLQRQYGGNSAENRLAIDWLQRLGYVEQVSNKGALIQCHLVPYKEIYGDTPAADLDTLNDDSESDD
ncbi:bifunctional DNA primase/polymerase [Nonomuraea sp. NPDC050786]|uniref:bifunctional DNA primase/polymerase n=1 Tax=Nonomuraea sp. NPDC050786 TaxID=3154840 RepID=UPI0033C8C574